MNNSKKLIVMVIAFTLILILSSSYALLRSTRTGKNNYVINVGDLEVNFQDTKTNALTASNMYPMTDEEGKEVEQELVFTVKNEGSVKAYYNISIEETSTEPEFKTVIKYLVKKNTDDYNTPTILSENKYIDSNAILEPNGEVTYHVKVYLSESADNTYMGKTFNANIKVDSSQETYINVPLLTTIKNKLNATNSINDGETTYLSGTNEQINFNYVWYSGKLWRITAINKDDTIKMVTQDEITTMHWGTDTAYKGSWMYQWLNEDFLDTLENQENIIVQNAKWNATADENDTPVKPAETTIVEGNVGSLNAYEYTQSYKKATESTNYLNIKYFWWLITPSNLSIKRVDGSGHYDNDSPNINTNGIRPSINLRANIKISGGEGTKEKPYRVEGDKAVAAVNDKLNSRVSGEYVNFDGKKYRIVGTENGITKLTSVDYLRNPDSSVMTKNFSSGTTNYGFVGTSTDYWAGYLNDTWYNSISETYKNMLVEGTYYFGVVASTSYKNTICSESNTTDTTKKCNRINTSWTGYVGLPRVGEMFSAQLEEGYSSSSNIWSITPFSSSSVRFINTAGCLSSISSPSVDAYAVRPSITLNSNVYITGGDGMSPDTAYEIKCDSCS